MIREVINQVPAIVFEGDFNGRVRKRVHQGVQRNINFLTISRAGIAVETG